MNAHTPPILNNKQEVLKLYESFIDAYPTEEACFDALLAKIYGGQVIFCAHCKSTVLDVGENKRVGRCRNCGAETWFTAGTFFDRIRRPRAWLFAIHCMSSGLALSSNLLSKLSGATTSTCWTILAKLKMVINEHESHADELNKVPSWLFDTVICRRSICTPAEQHPVCEVPGGRQYIDASQVRDSADIETLMNGDDDLDADIRQLTETGTKGGGSTLLLEITENERAVLACLEEEPIDFDTLCERAKLGVGQLISGLVLLEMRGDVLRKPGERYALKTSPEPKINVPETTARSAAEKQRLKSAVQRATEFFKEFFKGVSRKYLQHHAAAFWCYADPFWHGETLMNVCLQSDAIRYEEIRSYISPPRISLCV